MRRLSAAKKVPLTTSAQVPSGRITSSSSDLAERVEVVEDGEDRGEHDFYRGDEEEVRQGLADEESGGGSGREAVGVENVVAQLAGPRLIERGHGGEEQADPEQAAGDLAGDGGIGGGIEREREDDHDQQREEEHAVDGVFGAPLEAEVFAQMGEDVAERSSCAAACLLW